jgi:hypothetical protein
VRLEETRDTPHLHRRSDPEERLMLQARYLVLAGAGVVAVFLMIWGSGDLPPL